MNWGRSDLERLLADSRAGMSLDQMRRRQTPGVTAGDCDLCLWIAMGRSPDAALIVLNAKPLRAVGR